MSTTDKKNKVEITINNEIINKNEIESSPEKNN